MNFESGKEAAATDQVVVMKHFQMTSARLQQTNTTPTTLVR
jgi:hypothetical protein